MKIPAIYIFIFFPSIYVMVKRHTEGLKWNLSLTCLLFASVSGMLLLELFFFLGVKTVDRTSSAAVYLSESLVVFSQYVYPLNFSLTRADFVRSILADLIIVRHSRYLCNFIVLSLSATPVLHHMELP